MHGVCCVNSNLDESNDGSLKKAILVKLYFSPYPELNELPLSCQSLVTAGAAVPTR